MALTLDVLGLPWQIGGVFIIVGDKRKQKPTQLKSHTEPILPKSFSFGL